jgi:Zn-finger nucleic acid-binding protein
MIEHVALCPSCKSPMKYIHKLPDDWSLYQCPECKTVYADWEPVEKAPAEVKRRRLWRWPPPPSTESCGS